jgi:transposase InsO family protein
MNNIETSDTITLDDGSYDFIERRGTMVRLRHTATGQHVDMHLTELSRRRVGVQSTAAPEPRVLDDLALTQRSKALARAIHVREVLTGERDDRADVDPRYSSDRTLEERVASKLEDLSRVGEPTSRATLMRQIKGFRDKGTMGLVDRRALRLYGPLDQLDSRVHDALCHVVAAQRLQSTGTKSRLIRTTEEELLRRYGTDAPKLPSAASMYRYIDSLDGGRHTTGSAKTRQSLGQRPNRTFAKSMQMLPGSEIQVDSTTMDVFVKTKKGSERPILTIAVDVRTRSILAATIRLSATKPIDHVSLLLQILTPPQNRPDRTSHRELVQMANPHVAFIPAADSEKARASRPFIYPRRFMMDNGRDYIGDTFRAALEKFGIDISLSAPHTPTDKAIVERTFGSIHSMFTQYQPGYTGRSPEFRGHKVEKQALMSVEALFELFDDWVGTVWQNRPHSSLTHLTDASLTYSPNQMVAAAAELTSTLYLPLSESGYIELLPTTFRTITSTGVALANREYDSTELHPLRNTKSAHANQKWRWEVKYDPYNSQVVWVRSRENNWIECRARDESRVYEPFAEDLLPSDERSDQARQNAALTGVALHQEPRISHESTPSSFSDDDDDIDIDIDIDISPFDPSQE